MTAAIRPARPDDLDAVTAFTKETFEWGDYVPDAFPTWLAEPESHSIVAVDDDDRAYAFSRARLLSPTEAWFHAARVHPEERGRGVAGEMAQVLMGWAKDAGARVGRLLIEDWNEPSIRHVRKIGLRRVTGFTRCIRTVGEASPLPSGNGGRTAPLRLRPRQITSAEAEPAFASWSAGDLGRAGRGLFGHRYAFRRLTVDDVETAARAGSLWEVGAGWMMVGRREDQVEIDWVETRHEDAYDVMRAAVSLAVEQGAERLALWAPDAPWLVQAARRVGCEAHPMSVFAIAL